MSYHFEHSASLRGDLRRTISQDEDGRSQVDPFSLDDMQNRTGEPYRRRRIPRACESCRKRKIRCDGNEVCNSCRSSSLMCVYRDSDGAKLVKEHMQQFDTRLQRMEGLLSGFVMRFEAAQSKSSIPEKHSNTSAVPDPEVDIASQGGAKEPVAPVQIVCPPSPPLSHAQGAPGQRSGHQSLPPSSESDNREAKRRKHDHHRDDHERPTYADGYGELHTDEWDQLRYIGLSSTMSVVDICMPFREHINRGLNKKGYDHHNNFLGPSPSVCEAITEQSNDTGPDTTWPFAYGHLPPEPLKAALVKSFYEKMYFILPVISHDDFNAQLEEISNMQDHAARESDFLPVLYGLLAMASLNFTDDALPSDDPTLAAYRSTDLGGRFFALSRMGQSMAGQVFGRPTQLFPRRTLNMVIAMVLQAAYLSAIGSQAEAWISVGQAARLGQDLGLHRSAAQLGFSKPIQERRRYAWWCIYSMDRSLSAALGRPLAIQDADCDIELPQNDESGDSHDCDGFVTILNLRRILGEVVSTVASVRTVKASRHVSRKRELQAMIVGLDAQLRTWAAKEVPESIKAAADGPQCIGKFIALSGHFGALLLLYRFFIGNPHRESLLNGNEGLVQCARAATNCIHITDKMVTIMPVCGDLVCHMQHVFTSSVILLQCIRRSDDAEFIQEALNDVELATRCLRRLQRQWPGNTRLLATIEEYVEFTIKFIEGGMAGRCAFHHTHGEFTGLETRDGSSRFPSDWAQLAFKRLPIGPMRSFSDRNPYQGQQTPVIDLVTGPDAEQSSFIPPTEDSPLNINSFDSNRFRFTLPLQRLPTKAPAVTGTASSATFSSRSIAGKPKATFPSPFYPPRKINQPCHPLCREDDAIRPRGQGMETANNYVESFWIDDLDASGNRFLDSTTFLAGEGMWGLQ